MGSLLNARGSIKAKPFAGDEVRMILDMRWPTPPLVGPWHELAEDVADAFRVVLESDGSFASAACPPGEIGAFRVHPLLFWPDWMWVDALIEETGAASKVISFLYGPHGPHILDGTSRIFHDVNDLISIRIEQAEAVCDYLRVFCSAVRMEDKPFFIIESPGRLQQLIYPFDLPESAVPLARPLEAVRRRDGWKIHALVLFGATLFEATFLISTYGLVDMIDDKLLTDGLPDNPIRFDGIFYRQTGAGASQ